MDNSIHGKTTIMIKGIILMASILIAQQPSWAEHLFALRLEAKPFSSKMCQKMRRETAIRITAANHRDIILRQFPGQHIPSDPDQARKKNYVYYVLLEDLTNEQLRNGSIVFDSNHAIIIADNHPNGLSRPQFESLTPSNKRETVEKAFQYLSSITSNLQCSH